MYRSLYNLKSKPFELKPDPSFLWLGERHKETLFFLRYGILDNMGFLLLEGDKGTGKTTLINGLARGLKSDVEWAVISGSSHEQLDFYNEIVTGFGIDTQFTSKVEFFIQFSHFLHKAHGENKKVVLFVDDCHLLSQEILDELRLLSNIEKGDAKLIDIFFVGQPEFTEMLAVPYNHSIRQQLALKAKLVPFGANETGHYIRHRLKVSGAVEEIFTPRAVQLIHDYSQGVALEINVICERALQAGSAQGKKNIDDKLVEECIQELHNPVKPDQDDAESPSVGEKQAELSGEVDDQSVSAGVLNAKSRSWIPYTLAFLACIGFGFYFFLVKNEIPVIAETDSGGIGQENVVAVVPEVVESQEPDAKKDVSIAEPESLNTPLSKEQIDPPVVQVVEAVETVETPVAQVVEKTETVETPGAQVVEEAETVETPVVQVIEGTETIETPMIPVVEKTETIDPQVVQVIAEREKVEDVAPVIQGEVDETADKTVAVEEEKKELDQAVEQPGIYKPPALPPMEPEKVFLGLQPNTLKLTRKANVIFARFVETLLQYPDAKVLVKGYVSSDNDTLENMKLSEERAVSVQQLLIKRGMAAMQIEVKGMGVQDPIATNSTRAGRLKNRRVEIEVIDDGV